MKIELQVVSTLLNNFHLIHKGGMLMLKLLNYTPKKFRVFKKYYKFLII